MWLSLSLRRRRDASFVIAVSLAIVSPEFNPTSVILCLSLKTASKRVLGIGDSCVTPLFGDYLVCTPTRVKVHLLYRTGFQFSPTSLSHQMSTTILLSPLSLWQNKVKDDDSSSSASCRDGNWRRDTVWSDLCRDLEETLAQRVWDHIARGGLVPCTARIFPRRRWTESGPSPGTCLVKSQLRFDVRM